MTRCEFRARSHEWLPVGFGEQLQRGFFSPPPVHPERGSHTFGRLQQPILSHLPTVAVIVRHARARRKTSQQWSPGGMRRAVLWKSCDEALAGKIRFSGVSKIWNPYCMYQNYCSSFRASADTACTGPEAWMDTSCVRLYLGVAEAVLVPIRGHCRAGVATCKHCQCAANIGGNPWKWSHGDSLSSEVDPDETLDSKRDSFFAGTRLFSLAGVLQLPRVGGFCVMPPACPDGELSRSLYLLSGPRCS